MAIHLILSKIIGWIFGCLFLIVGLLNTFRASNAVPGITYVVLPMIYFSPVNVILKDLFAFRIPYCVKMILAALIIWSLLAAGIIGEEYYPEIIKSL